MYYANSNDRSNLDISLPLGELSKIKVIKSYFDEMTHIYITFHVNKIYQIPDANLQLLDSKINTQTEFEDIYKCSTF